MDKDLDQLKSSLRGKVIIVGIGNTLRSDDAAGSLIAQRMKGSLHFTVFDAGTSPENYLDKIIREKPDTVLFIDTAHLGKEPGSLRVVREKEIHSCNLPSTHNASFELSTNYLKNALKADIIFLFIQPKTVVFGESLSPEVEAAIAKIEESLYEVGKEKR